LKVLKLDKKSIDKLKDRLDAIEEEETSREETDYEIQATFTKLREARAKKTDAFGNKTYEDVWYNITEEEEEYYRRKRHEADPAVRYQQDKEEWWFHPSSWYMRDVDGFDGKGCNNGVCVPECRYFAPTGRLEFEEVEAELQKYKEEKKAKKEKKEEDEEEEEQ
jgi:hypothetical protein